MIQGGRQSSSSAALSPSPSDIWLSRGLSGAAPALWIYGGCQFKHVPFQLPVPSRGTSAVALGCTSGLVLASCSLGFPSARRDGARTGPWHLMVRVSPPEEQGQLRGSLWASRLSSALRVRRLSPRLGPQPRPGSGLLCFQESSPLFEPSLGQTWPRGTLCKAVPTAPSCETSPKKAERR